MTAQESGLHFCKFVLAKEEGNERTAVTVVTKEELSGLIGDYALLLPYSKKDEDSKTSSLCVIGTGMSFGAAAWDQPKDSLNRIKTCLYLNL